MKRKIVVALLALPVSAVLLACSNVPARSLTPLSDVEQLADFVSPPKGAQGVALEVEALKAWMMLNIEFSGRGPNFDQARLEASFAEAVKSAEADNRRALVTALEAADAGRREEALQFFRSADGQQMLANERQYDDKVRAWLQTPKDKRGDAPPEYVASEAEKVFAASEAVKILSMAVNDAHAKTEQLPTAME